MLIESVSDYADGILRWHLLDGGQSVFIDYHQAQGYVRCLSCQTTGPCDHIKHAQGVLGNSPATRISEFIKRHTAISRSPEFVGGMLKALDQAAGVKIVRFVVENITTKLDPPSPFSLIDLD